MNRRKVLQGGEPDAVWSFTTLTSLNWRKVLLEGERLLSGKVSGSAAAEARELLFSMLAWNLSDYALRRNESADEEKVQEYLALIKRRREGEPLQYITGIAPFFGYEFKSDRRALIPRFDTEILVEEALRRIRPGMRILDICTGSGCVPIALAKTLEERWILKEEPQTPEVAFAKKECLERTRKKVDKGVSSINIEASDISEDALALARENAKRLGASVHFFRSDLLLSAEGRYDLITANPPYITEEEMRNLDKEVLDHEPHLALSGGPDGLTFYRRIVSEAQRHLSPGGCLLMEIGCKQAAAVEELCAFEGFTEIKTVKDLAGRDRVVTARRRN